MSDWEPFPPIVMKTVDYYNKITIYYYNSTITIRKPSVCISNVFLRYGDQAHWFDFKICILNRRRSNDLLELYLSWRFQSIKQRIESGPSAFYRNFSDHSRRGNFIVMLNSLGVSTNTLPPWHNSLLLAVATAS